MDTGFILDTIQHLWFKSLITNLIIFITLFGLFVTIPIIININSTIRNISIKRKN
jgi:hypothetical protein